MPQVSFLLIAYGQERTVVDAVASVLAQDYHNLQVLLSDDCSPDGTGRVMREAAECYAGPHRVKVLRTPRNLGLMGHLTWLQAQAEGDLCVVGAGDDLSEPGRVRNLVRKWQAAGGGDAVLCSDYIPIDREGRVVSKVEGELFKGEHRLGDMAAGVMRVHGATQAWTPSVFARFAEPSRAVAFEDRILPFRALLLGGKLLFVDEPLVRYRIEGGLSRIDLPSTDEFLGAFTLRAAGRNGIDAAQRLLDAASLRPDDRALLRSCARTVLDHGAVAAFAAARRGSYEIVLAKQLLTGARRDLVLRTYLRYRLRRLFGWKRARLLKRWEREFVTIDS